MSHCYILQSFKRYKASLARCNHKKIHDFFFGLLYICTKTYRKFYEPLWKPIFGKQIPNFLCHTVQNRFGHFTGPVQSVRGSNCLKMFIQVLQKKLNVSDLKSDSKQKSYAQNSDFVPFAKTGFVTV